MNGAQEMPLGRLARRIWLALKEPHRVGQKLRQLATRGRARSFQADPAIETGGGEPTGSDLRVYRPYRQHAERIGLDGIILFLSFDCDTDLDPKASLEVMAFLDALGIKATFAVPGTQLERGAEIYRKIAAKGSEFMNHGHLPHAEWRDDRYVGITFYETMSFDIVEADIRKGHETVERMTGKPPLGFRAPHFGHFQKPEQLALVHRLARDLNYHYCSTTIPSYGFDHGPAHDVDGVVELATFGSTPAPTTILDSWTYLSDRRDYALSNTYGDLLIQTVDELGAAGMPALLTWYVDPCHVVGQAPFERAMRHLALRNIESLSGMEAAALARPH